MEISTSTEPYIGVIDSDLQERWFDGFIQEAIPTFTASAPATRSKTSGRVDTESRLEQRESEDIADIIEQVDVDEEDCLADSVHDIPFLTVTDIFGRERKVRLGSKTGAKILERNKKLEKHAADEKRRIESYEDI